MIYVTDEAFTKCSFKIDIHVEQALTIVFIIPLINELQRTIDTALAGEDFDFSFVTDRITKNVDRFIQESKEAAISISKGDFNHSNADIKVFVKAPILKIYQNIFDE